MFLFREGPRIGSVHFSAGALEWTTERGWKPRTWTGTRKRCVTECVSKVGTYPGLVAAVKRAK
jgi:hypothetical protein